MSNKLVPVSRRELIQRLGDLGLEGPFKGSGHDYMIRGMTRITIPNVHKEPMILRQGSCPKHEKPVCFKSFSCEGKDVGVRLLMQVLKEAKINIDDWISSGLQFYII